MRTSETEFLCEELSKLELEHRALDDAIARRMRRRESDELETRRLKKRKLALKDRITLLQSRLLPDLHA